MFIRRYAVTSITLLVNCIVISGCSNEAWYKGATSSHEVRCLEESNSDYEACKTENQHTYDEYKQAKEELNKDSK